MKRLLQQKFYSCFCLPCILYLCLALNVLGQNGTVLLEQYPAPSLGPDKIAEAYVYLPSGYSESAEPYRLFIYLHGAGGSNHTWKKNFFTPLLDDMIAKHEIEPLVVVFPSFVMPIIDGTRFLNAHMYTDSPRNGNFKSVVTIDLMDWLTNTYNVANVREKRAIGGFSMGGDGAARIAITNSDKFIAFASNDGNVSISEYQVFLPDLLEECPWGGEPFFFFVDPEVYNNTLMWAAMATAFSPNMVDPNVPFYHIDFPVDESGNLSQEIFWDKWVAHYDPITLMQDPAIYKQPIEIYFDTHTCPFPYDDAMRSSGKILADRFHQELDKLGIEHTYKIWDDNRCHHFEPPEAGRELLKFIDRAMDKAAGITDKIQTTVIRQFRLDQNYPNPFNTSTKISFELTESAHVKLAVYNIMGREIKVVVDDDLSQGQHHISWNASDQVSGIYFCTLFTHGQRLTRRITLVK